MGRIRAAGGPARRRAPGPRPRPGQRRRLLPLQLPRVLRDFPRRPEDPRGARQRELPLRRRRVAGAAGELRGRGALLRLGAARAGGVDPPRGPRGSPARRGRRGCLRRSLAGSLRLSGADRLVRAGAPDEPQRAGCLLVVHGRDHRPAQGRPVHDRPRRGQLAQVARAVPRHEHRARDRGLRGRAGTQRPSPGRHPGVAAHAQHRVHLRLAPHADLGRAGGYARGPVIRRARAPRHDRCGPGPGRRHRRRRVRAPAAARPGRRCAGRPLRHLITADHLLGGHRVERPYQAAPARARAASRPARLLRVNRRGHLRLPAGAAGRPGLHRQLRGGTRPAGDRPGSAGTAPRGGRPAGRPDPGSGLPQGPAAKRRHLFHQRRRAARCARRPRPDRGRRQRDADRPGYERDQHGRREGPPGGGGGGPQRAGRCRGVPGRGRP